MTQRPNLQDSFIRNAAICEYCYIGNVTGDLDGQLDHEHVIAQPLASFRDIVTELW